MPEPEDLAEGKLRLDWPADQVARLTIRNAGKANALDHAILDALATTLRTLAERDARSLIVAAAGQVFSAGYDIGNPGEQPDFAPQAEALVAHPFHAAIEALEAFPYPVVAAVNGHAIGGGLELALSCDLRIAAASAKLGMPPAKLGLVYSHTGLRKFIDAIGAPRTRELFLLGNRIDAATALSWGLVNEVVDREELEQRALATAAQLAANAPLSTSGNKRIIAALLAAQGELDPLVEQELIELRRACFTSHDFFEGVKAFSEKRVPRWTGS